ncbi:hypothetical protein [Streptomyces sp. NPDC056660]|uniref:hypothetical protein n=1 Tax=Streptomyces sp. NPDC056660 TaxID=3345897 RepID=UPI0036C493F8
MSWAQPATPDGDPGGEAVRRRALGAGETCTLDDLAQAANVVIDYVWGEPTARAMVDMLTALTDRSAPLTCIEIGSVAGPTAPIRCAALRSPRLHQVTPRTRVRRRIVLIL